MSCERANQCKSEKKGRGRGGKCSGCSYQWRVKELECCKKQPNMKEICNKIEEDCWEASRKGSYGGRFRLDKSIENVLLNMRKDDPTFPALERLKKKVVVSLETGEEPVPFDCAFTVSNTSKAIFIECKPTGNEANSLYSAIFSAKLLRENPKYRDCLFYVVGYKDHNYYSNIIKHHPIVRWAEKMGIVQLFCGLKDLKSLFDDIKEKIGSAR